MKSMSRAFYFLPLIASFLRLKKYYIALHIAETGSIPGTPYGSLSPIKSDSWAENQE